MLLASEGHGNESAGVDARREAGREQDARDEREREGRHDETQHAWQCSAKERRREVRTVVQCKDESRERGRG